MTDKLLAPFAGHKSMANFGVEDGALTDACFPVFSAMPKLRYLPVSYTHLDVYKRQVDQFAKTHVGMSTGWISGDFWQATAIPLLMKRLEQANRS